MVGLLAGGLVLALSPGFEVVQHVSAGSAERDLVRNGSFELDPQGREISHWTVFDVGPRK